MRLKSLEASHIARDGLPLGTLAPPFSLPLVRGGEVALRDYAGERLLLVFSDPNCGPCNVLLPSLERLQRRTRLQVLVISRGTVDQNIAKLVEHALTLPVALQRSWEVSRDYAMFATPTAYLLDESSRTATDVLVGPDAILSIGERVWMDERIEQQLGVLRDQLNTGQIELDAVERRRKYLHETLLRISGAVQALENLLGESMSAAASAPSQENGQASKASGQPLAPALDEALSTRHERGR